MARLGAGRQTLARMLRQHDENDLADRAIALSDDELARVETLGAYYAFSEDAMASGGSMGGSRALSLAAVDVLDGSGRELRLSRPEARDAEDVERWAEADLVRDRELRRNAAAQQVPADESLRTLDRLDPPAWGPAPVGASAAIRRCHELRTTPLRDFSAEDLRIMLEHQVALNLLVGMALSRLQDDPLLDSGRHPGDLLASVLAVDAAFWEHRYDPEVSARQLAKRVRERSDLEAGLRSVVETFIHDHPHRSAAHLKDP